MRNRPLHVIRDEMRNAYEQVATLKAMLVAGHPVTPEAMRRARSTAQALEHELALLRRGGVA